MAPVRRIGESHTGFQYRFFTSLKVPEQAFAAADQKDLVYGKTAGANMMILDVPADRIGIQGEAVQVTRHFN
ncbi:hypothetical protein D3C71_2093170 [compost metagenome]